MKIRQARQQGNSVVLTLTGFIEYGKFYRIEKRGKETVITEVKGDIE